MTGCFCAPDNVWDRQMWFKVPTTHWIERTDYDLNMCIDTRSNMTNNWKRLILAFTGCSCKITESKTAGTKVRGVYSKHTTSITRHRPVFCKGYWFENFQET